jgi:GT2 family glycosyltransferase
LLPKISVVVLSYMRKDALRHTLSQLAGMEWSQAAHGGEVIVVDNASTDGSAEMVRQEFAWVRLIALERNTLIEGFNIGARAARGELLLILDDDSWPEAGSVEAASAYVRSQPGVGGVMLHRRHPRTMQWEWPFAAEQLKGVQQDWPDMGCGNLFRREAWNRVGGYTSAYELYRNDTDIALKLAGAGYRVVFCREWLVWHDSKIASKKSDKWLWLSTRNWVWMARRHARGVLRVRGIVLGWLHAHRLAGLRLSGHASVLRGVMLGLVRRAPAMEAGVQPGGEAYARLLRLKMRVRG